MKIGRLKRPLIRIYEWALEKRRIGTLRLKYHLHIMTPDHTLRYIEKTHCSIARFGDGEFDHILALKEEGFQKQTPALQADLKKVFMDPNPSLLLCVPRCMNTIRECTDHAGTFWIEWGRNGHHEQIVDMIRSMAGPGYVFGDAQITRPYIDWVSDRRAKRLFPGLRRLWEGRDIILAEGDQTRMGVGNDLFDNARSVKRILCPAVDAFDVKDEIKNTILKHFSGELILMALGPTATVLASEFAGMGIQALDIGNIDIEYEWYLRGAKERIPIPGKYTNEAKNGSGRVFSECRDEKYLNQITARVGC
jgi:glycosyltransferase family protein